MIQISTKNTSKTAYLIEKGVYKYFREVMFAYTSTYKLTDFSL